MSNQSGELVTFIGTYTRSTSKGIYKCVLDMATGELRLTGATTASENPTFLALHPSRRFLYAVNEINEFGGESTGAASAFAIDPDTHDLTPLNQQATHGTGPCHLTVNATGKFLLVANYQSGSFCVLPIAEDGSLSPASCVIQHEGGSVNPNRQQGPHAHSINLDWDNRFAVAADLGIDEVVMYRLDLQSGKLVRDSSVKAAPGAGPRHFDFHPNGQFGYLINELGNTITAYAYYPINGRLGEIESVPTLPKDWQGANTTADIHVSPPGRFVYGSNRGHDSIVIYAIDEATGRLSYVGHQSTQGQKPRNFAIDPSGTYLLAANQDSDTIVSFRIDAETGKLTPTGHVASVPMPVCIRFLS
jgi:6-phosphogluconolactonase